MKKVLSVLIIMCMLGTIVMGCGSSGKEKVKSVEKDTKKEYVSESDISNVFSNPDKYKGKYIKLSGQIFVEPEKEDDKYAIQAWHDPQNAQNNFIVYYKGTESFKTNDYIEVDGKITGQFEGENALGGTVTAPIIKADSITVKTYMEAVAPTTKEIVPENAVSEQEGISLKVDKIEFAEKETRVYLTESNSSSEKFSMWTYNIKIVQNGKQIEQDNASISAYEGNYEQLSGDILPNASSTGVLVFPPMDSSASFQIYAEGMSDNYELQFSPFTIDIAAQ